MTIYELPTKQTAINRAKAGHMTTHLRQETKSIEQLLFVIIEGLGNLGAFQGTRINPQGTRGSIIPGQLGEYLESITIEYECRVEAHFRKRCEICDHVICNESCGHECEDGWPECKDER